MIRAFLAFPLREIRMARSYRFAFFLNFGSIAFGVITFFFLGKLFSTQAPEALGRFGGNYFPYVLIGIATSTFLVSTLNGLAGMLRREQSLGTLETILACPTPHSLVMVGLVSWNIFHALIMGATYIAVGSFFTPLEVSLLGVIKAGVVLFLSALTFMALGALAGAFILYFKRGNPITWIFSSLSILLGGVYFPVSLLPTPFQGAAQWIPLTYTIELLRRIFLNNASWSELATGLWVLFGFAVVLLPISIFFFRVFLREAQRAGSLGHQ